MSKTQSTPGNTSPADANEQVEKIVEANLQLDDVVCVFHNIPATPSYRKYYKCRDLPTSCTGMVQSHFKGIASYGDKIIFSHTNVDLMPTSNGKMIVADLLPGPGLAATEETFDTLHPGWPHPCSTQACGSFMALGIQASASPPGSDVSEIQILDIRRAEVNMPFALIGTIERPRIGVNGVGFTKMAANGLYLIAAVNGNTLTLYRSLSPQLMIDGLQGNAVFNEIFQTDSFAESGAGLALLTQADGGIFLLTMNADNDGSNSKACLYTVTDVESPSPSPAVNKVDEVNLPITDLSDTVSELEKYVGSMYPELSWLLAALGTTVLNSSFRWGKGLAITSPTTIEIYASDRNVIPLSHIPVIGSEKDFSVVVWASAKTT